VAEYPTNGPANPQNKDMGETNRANETICSPLSMVGGVPTSALGGVAIYNPKSS